MAENEDIKRRLDDYSLRTNTNAMANALIDQRLTIAEKRLDEYHHRLHTAEDAQLVVKTIQSIHDTQIQAMRKILVGNGDRETIPMDLDRLERNIQEILKVDYKAIDELKMWRKEIDSRAWQIGLIVIGLIVANVWSLIAK